MKTAAAPSSRPDSIGAGAPGQGLEIEITPEMIEAGVVAICGHDFEDEYSEIVESVYRAMERAMVISLRRRRAPE